MKKRKMALKLGNLYVVDWDDHWSRHRAATNDPDSDTPVVMRTYGRLVGASPKLLKLEFTRPIGGNSNDSHSLFGILKSCIVNVKDLGPDPTVNK